MRNTEIEGFEDAIDSNGIGEIVRSLIQNNPTLKIGMATATPFRGDRLSIFGGMEDRFVQFSIPYDEYFKSLRWLNSFNFDFVLSNDFTSDIQNIMRQSKKDIIYIPAPNSTCSKNWLDDKLKHAEAIISSYLYCNRFMVERDAKKMAPA